MPAKGSTPAAMSGRTLGQMCREYGLLARRQLRTVRMFDASRRENQNKSI
jgi:hypothetical protein